MPLNVDLSLNVKLVEIIKDFPCLYDSFLPDYFKRDVTDEAWDSVSLKMKESVADCKQKWRNLRTVYVRKLKVEAESGGKRNRPYYLTSVMEFLKPFVRVKHTNKPINSSSGFECVEAELSNSRDSGNNDLEHDTELEEVQDEETYLGNKISVKIEETETRVHPSRCSGINENLDSPLAEEIILPPSSKKRKLDADNPRIQFLLSMEPDIQIMTDVQMRKFKRKVLEIIDEILDE